MEELLAPDRSQSIALLWKLAYDIRIPKILRHFINLPLSFSFVVWLCVVCMRMVNVSFRRNVIHWACSLNTVLIFNLHMNTLSRSMSKCRYRFFVASAWCYATPHPRTTLSTVYSSSSCVCVSLAYTFTRPLKCSSESKWLTEII